MKRLIFILMMLSVSIMLMAKDYEVSGPQGGLAMTLTLPDKFDTQNDSCPLVILMHGIFAGQNIQPMPSIAKHLAKQGIASIRFDFGGHWDSEGEMQLMTIEKEIQDALAMWDYASKLAYVSKIGLLGHSQGGVVASMTAGRIAATNDKALPYGLVLIAPASVLPKACQNGNILGAKFDPENVPEYVKCFGVMPLGRDYILSTQKLDIYGTAKAYQGPVLILHGSEDELVPMWCSKDYAQLYGDAAELIVVEGENHRISKKRQEVATLVTTFFKSLR